MTKFSTDIRTVPNVITLSRIVFMALAALFVFTGYPWSAVICGIIAGITDYADGIIARRTGQETYLGAILDQFSDLITETIAFLFITHHPDGFHPAFFFVYLFREFWVGTIRRFMAAHQIDIRSNIFGKLKTNFIGWGCLLWFVHITRVAPALDLPVLILASVGLYGGLAFAYLSAFSYTRQFVVGYNKLEAA